MKVFYKLFLFAALFIVAQAGFSQVTVTGTVLDAELGEPLPGANILVKGTTNGTTTDFEGNFILNVSQNTGNLVISYIGFLKKEVSFTISGGTANVGSVSLDADAQELEGVVVVGTGIIDLARDRETPVAVSTIMAEEIQTKLGNQEFPEILNTTPSVYATKEGGGYGDSRINVRGFDQRNTAIIINGQPVNDMENGWVYWSNWQGLSDIASGMQVQRGLGASKLAVPSVGGTITIVTKSTDREEGGFISTTAGNDSYIKTMVGYDTGINEKGWASSVLLGRWSGDGYVDGTEGEGYTYLLSLGYKPSNVHAFNFTFTGAGQWHHQRSTFLSVRDHFNFGGDDFRKFNADWGNLNGDEYSFRRNFYNKPIGTLNWDWNISDRLSLSTSIYGSWGRGGGTGTRGRNFGINPFNEDLTQAMEDGDLPYRTAEGIIDFDAVVANNMAGTPYSRVNSRGDSGPYTGLIVGTNTDLFGYDGTSYSRANNDGINSNIAIRRSSMNSHNWYGAISNLKYENNLWTFGGGIDLRTYTGYHYRVVNDLLGLDAYYSTGNQNLSGPYYRRSFDGDNNPYYTPVGGYFITETIDASPFKDTGINSDKIDYYNLGKVNWIGFNGIIEYNNQESISAVLQAGISNQSYKRIDYFDQPLNVESDTESITGGYIKGGANYNINEQQNVFFNAGYIARQPLFDAVFPNFANAINEDVTVENIISFEIGYGYKSSLLNANINLYNTSWKDRFASRGVDLGGGIDGTANYEGIEQLHQGLEIELVFRPLESLTIDGMMSAGNWRYTDNVTASVFDDNQDLIGTSTLYLEDVKVGDAAQFTASIGVNYEVIDNLDLNVVWRNSSKLYADFNVIEDDNFLAPDNPGALELPSFNLFDLGIGYGFFNNSLKARLNINNVLDEEYIAESNTNIHSTADSELYNGIDNRNNVWFGFGTTWNFSLRYNF